MTARATAAVFDPEAMETALRGEPAAALEELASYIRMGKISLRVRRLEGVGSTDIAHEHFLLSLDLGVRVWQQITEHPLDMAEDAMRDLLEGRALTRGVKRCPKA